MNNPLREGAGAGTTDPGITIVMPVLNAASYLGRTLPALLATAGDAEVIVVDDCSSDDSPRIADRPGVRLVQLAGHGGAAAARNRGVAESSGDIIVFVDADVLVCPTCIERIVERLESTGADAVFGSYDDDPPAPGFFSQYTNLRHHYYHHRGGGASRTFWAGFGAIRRAAFEQAGGFDPAFTGIEDVAMGYRLTKLGGRIIMDPSIQVTHLKHWSLRRLVKTDILMRALPWSRLILSGRGGAALNVDWPERLRACLALLLVVAVALAPWSGIGWAVAGAVGAAVAANVQMARVFMRRRGALFALRAIAWHQVYYFYAGSTFLYAWLESIVRPCTGGGGRAETGA